MQRVKRHRLAYQEAGMVQINPWVPAEFKIEVLDYCAKLRAEHFKKLGKPLPR